MLFRGQSRGLRFGLMEGRVTCLIRRGQMAVVSITQQGRRPGQEKLKGPRKPWAQSTGPAIIRLVTSAGTLPRHALMLDGRSVVIPGHCLVRHGAGAPATRMS